MGLVLLQVFRLPLPGAPVVTGSYGELRGTTLHLGIDFGVGERIGEVPVLAAGSGYVYRLRVSHTGYGKVVYVQHPNGLRTVYGHLSHFAPIGEERVQRLQEVQRRFEVETYLPPEAWPVKAGDTLGWAGNSGYSFGPHLHFEVRTSRDETLPPYPYLSLRDSVPPVFIRLGLVPISPRSAIQGRATYYFLRLAQKKKDPALRLYTVLDTIAITDRVGVVYTAGDRMSAGAAWTGVAEVTLRNATGELLYQVRWDSLSYDWRRYVLWHVDEPYNQIFRVGVERLYREGVEFPWTRGSGQISLRPGEVQSYEVMARDFAGNRAIVRFTLRGEEPGKAIERIPLDPARSWSIERGLLVARKPYQVVFADGSYDSVATTRPLPLSGRAPRWLIGERDTQPAHVVAILYPGHAAQVNLGRGCTLEVFSESLLDTVYLQAFWEEGSWGPVLSVGETWMPLRSPGRLLWTLPDLPPHLLRRMVPIYRGQQGSWEPVSGYARQGRVLAVPLRRWGRYSVVCDTLPPTLRPLRPQGPFYLVHIQDFGSNVDPYSLRVEVLGAGSTGQKALYPEYYLPQHCLYLPRAAGRAFRIRVRDKADNGREWIVRF